MGGACSAQGGDESSAKVLLGSLKERGLPVDFLKRKRSLWFHKWWAISRLAERLSDYQGRPCSTQLVGL